MAIVLIEDSLPARTTYQGYDTVSVVSGKHLVIETSPAGEELLDFEIPAGGPWNVTVNVHIAKT